MLFDGYIGEYVFIQCMVEYYCQWYQSCCELVQYQYQSQECVVCVDLLQYQFKELNEFNLLLGEFEQIDEEYKCLVNSGQLFSICQYVFMVLVDGEEVNLQSQFYIVKQLVSELVGMDSKFFGVLDMLEEVVIQFSEVSDELCYYYDCLDFDLNCLFEFE